MRHLETLFRDDDCWEKIGITIASQRLRFNRRPQRL